VNESERNICGILAYEVKEAGMDEAIEVE